MDVKPFFSLATVIGCLSVPICVATFAFGQTWKPGQSSIDRLSGSITGNAQFSTGSCSQGFSDQCPSGHICGCMTVTDAKFFSTGIGQGSANIFATIDSTFAYGDLKTSTPCAPTYVELDVAAKNDSPTFAARGGLCFEPNGNALFTGAMGLTSSKLFKDSGAAAFDATLESTSGLGGGLYRFRMTFRGTAE